MALGAASRERADAFLRKQERLSDLQIARLEAQDRHFHEEAELELSHLRLRRFSGWAKAIFEASLGLLALAVLCGLGIMVWDAAHADGLVIEEFSVPPDLAAKGMTDQAVASLMLDKLTVMQNATASFRPAKSYSNNWGNDLKVEIPDTGISFGEAYRFLCGWLGHETRISGEVYWADKNITVNVRASGEPGATVTGPASDIDALIQKASEKLYGNTRAVQQAPSIPFAYNDWGRSLLERGKSDAAIGKFELSNQKGPHFADPLEGWGEALMQESRSDLALAKFEEANKYAPNWGRLHLKWGEAVMYAGMRDDAKRQFAVASRLDLSSADAAALARVRWSHTQ